MYKVIILLFLFTNSIFASNESLGKEVRLEWLDTNSELNDVKEIYVKAYLEAYKDFTYEQLGFVVGRESLQDSFVEIEDAIRDASELAVVVKIEDKIVGFACFKKTAIFRQIYISRLAVDPSYWNRGVGRKLIFSIFDRFKEINHLVVVTRRINEAALQFYQRLGFVKSIYAHQGYDSNIFIGLEFFLTNNPQLRLQNSRLSALKLL